MPKTTSTRFSPAVRQAERDQGLRPGSTTAEQERIERMRSTALEREVRALRQANEILRKASAYFAMAERTGPIHLCPQA